MVTRAQQNMPHVLSSIFRRQCLAANRQVQKKHDAALNGLSPCGTGSHHLTIGSNIKILDHVKTACGTLVGKRVLEIGHGSGHLIGLFLGAGAEEVVGVDFRHANNFIRTLILPDRRVRLRVGDIMALSNATDEELRCYAAKANAVTCIIGSIEVTDVVLRMFLVSAGMSVFVFLMPARGSADVKSLIRTQTTSRCIDVDLCFVEVALAGSCLNRRLAVITKKRIA